MPHKSRFHPCQVCTNPYRYQIEEAWKNKPVRNKNVRHSIADRFMPELGIKLKVTFFKAMDNHFHKEHFRESKKYPYLGRPDDSPQKIPQTSINELSQSLLDIGKQMADYYKENPQAAIRNLNFRDIFAAQDTITKRMMVQVERDAVKIQMAKLFSGQMPKTFKFEEGKLVDENDSQSLIRLLSEDTK